MKCIKFSKLLTALVVATTFGVLGINKLSAAPNDIPNVKILGLVHVSFKNTIYTLVIILIAPTITRNVLDLATSVVS